MRLHTNLSESDILSAGVQAGVVFQRLDEYGSRKRPRAFDVILSGRGRRGNRYGVGDFQSASWDQWGVFLGALYRKDAAMVAGEAYSCAEHFDWSTNHRYDGTEFAHCFHTRWSFDGYACTNGYGISHCASCGTVKRWLSGGAVWSATVGSMC